MGNAGSEISTEGQLVRAALGEEWCKLSSATRARFETDPDTPVEYIGTMSEVSCSKAGKLMAVVSTIFGAPLIPYNGTNIPIHVRVYKKPGNPDIFKQRTYNFPGRQPFIVQTRMHLSKQGSFIEYAGLGLGMAMQLAAKDGNLYFYGVRYVLDLGLLTVPIPSWLTPGMAKIEHSDYEEKKFRVRIEMHHPILGTTFIQDGIFEESR